MPLFLLPAIISGVGAAVGGALAGSAITGASREFRSGVETAAQTIAGSIDRATNGALQASGDLQRSIIHVCGVIEELGQSGVTAAGVLGNYHLNAAAVLGNYHLNAAMVLSQSADRVAVQIGLGVVALTGLNQAILRAQHTLESSVANLIGELRSLMNLAGKWAIAIVVIIAFGCEFRFGQGVPLTQLILAYAFSFPFCLVPLFAFTWGFGFAIYTNSCRHAKLTNATQELRLHAAEAAQEEKLQAITNRHAQQLAGIQSSLAVPGAISAYAGERLPPGYLWCNGAEYAVADYPALYQAIGNAHGSSGDGLRFRVPDYRGRFLRGVDVANSNRDPGRDARVAMNAGGNVGGRVGSIQSGATARPSAHDFTITGTTDARGGHTHAMHTGWSVRGYETGLICFATSLNNEARYKSVDGADAAPDHTHVVNGSVNGGGDAETRPCNAYVNYIIKC